MRKIILFHFSNFGHFMSRSTANEKKTLSRSLRDINLVFCGADKFKEFVFLHPFNMNEDGLFQDICSSGTIKNFRFEDRPGGEKKITLNFDGVFRHS